MLMLARGLRPWSFFYRFVTVICRYNSQFWIVKVTVTLRVSQSASPSWCQAPIWDPRPILSPWDFLVDSYGLLCSSALSDERTGLYFVSISLESVIMYIRYLHKMEARGSVVVKALCYKPEGRGFDTRWGEFLNLLNPFVRTRPWGLLNL
jgi:hypothetical protein